MSGEKALSNALYMARIVAGLELPQTGREAALQPSEYTALRILGDMQVHLIQAGVEPLRIDEATATRIITVNGDDFIVSAADAKDLAACGLVYDCGDTHDLHITPDHIWTLDDVERLLAAVKGGAA